MALRIIALIAMALFTTLLVSLGLAGCGSDAQTDRVPPPPTTTIGVGHTAPLLAVYENSVPERPWWQGWRPPSPPPRPITEHVVISGDVLFQTGSAALTDGAQTQLVGVLRLAQLPGAHVTIDGYTDNVPIDIVGGNVTLSKRRAKAVAGWLESQGVSTKRITTHGFGASDPVATNTTTHGRAQNRRVEITVTAP